MFWVDETIENIVKRREKKYLVTDYKTPSGKIHIGSLRGVIIHDAIFQGIKNLKKTVDYWYGFDDFDPMDGLTKDLEKEFSQHMGEPLCNIPAPKKGYKNFAQYYAQDFIKVFESIGAKPKIVWASQLYRSGKYNSAIKLNLDNAKTIRQIYQQVSGSVKPKDWYAFQVVCPKCGKIGTTRVFDWDGKMVSFVCEPNMVKWAKGCGFKGKISPYDGNGKMPYKAETPAKWFTFGTSVELAGKDHFTKGGTFEVAKKIAREIFKINPAYGYGYEWFLLGGKKMSTSKGIGSSASDIAQVLNPELLRFLMVRTRAQRTIDFDPFSEAVPLLYDELDRCIDAYLADPKSDLGRAYYYSKMSEASPPTYRMRFSKVAYILQMQRADIFQYAEEEKSKKLDKIELAELKVRIIFAKKWLENFAPENYKFTIQKSLPAAAKKLNSAQKKFLAEIADILLKKKYSGEKLHQEIHEIKKNQNISPREAFSAIYLSIIGKESGPQAGWLLASLDRNFVIKRFREI
ncbi:MAG: lysine--tRNA ligase [Patescibacteria group bacterium]|nr:lysine--tRNA ligase [Patescibacteria group bacterium]